MNCYPCPHQTCLDGSSITSAALSPLTIMRAPIQFSVCVLSLMVSVCASFEHGQAGVQVPILYYQGNAGIRGIPCLLSQAWTHTVMTEGRLQLEFAALVFFKVIFLEVKRVVPSTTPHSKRLDLKNKTKQNTGRSQNLKIIPTLF